jgi:hypothetical protein
VTFRKGANSTAHPLGDGHKGTGTRGERATVTRVCHARLVDDVVAQVRTVFPRRRECSEGGKQRGDGPTEQRAERMGPGGQTNAH